MGDEDIKKDVGEVDLEKLLDEWVGQSLSPPGRRTNVTLQSYASNIRKVAGGRQTFGTYQEFIKYLTERVNTREQWDENRVRTWQKRTTALNTLLRYLEGTGRIKEAPRYKLHFPPREETPLNPISKEDFQRILVVIPSESYLGARDRAMFSLMYFGGLKSGEIEGLNFGSFRIEGAESKKIYLVVGAGYKKREFKLDKQTAESFLDYITLYIEAAKSQALPGLEQGAFFRNKFGTKINARSIRRKFEGYATKAGLAGYNLESLRCGYASEQVALGKREDELARSMGILPNPAKRIIERLSQS